MNKKTILARLMNYRARLDLYYEAETAILNGAQSYSIGSRSLTRANLIDIRRMITELEDKIDEYESALDGKGFRRCVRGLPRDI